jgi:hypothetical protein
MGYNINKMTSRLPQFLRFFSTHHICPNIRLSTYRIHHRIHHRIRPVMFSGILAGVYKHQVNLLVQDDVINWNNVRLVFLRN